MNVKPAQVSSESTGKAPKAQTQVSAKSSPKDVKKRTAKIYAVTAYSVGDDYTPSTGITASGKPVEEGVTAACPKELPFGTKLRIEGVGDRVCTDGGGRIKGRKIDVYIPKVKDALIFGKKKLRVEIRAGE
ncbi:3D domain-containing protein [Paenibacillus tuaregi]|uniref:3D domain-containing protein n=1 Tax=Paenibacillus tuaregi TaxID=1816681 RepID=UPI0009EEE1FD|nr:3D domain-containing protein [Paenibacillus tuaregi]